MMKRHSVEALWPSSPPPHHVVALSATRNPPALWTGGSGGKIIAWKLPSLPPPPQALHTSSPQNWGVTAEPKRKEKEKLELPDFFEMDKNPAALNLLFQSAEILKTARHYEVVFLVHEDHVDQLEDVIQKVKDFIEEKKGKIHRLNDWGMRKLAYKIGKARRANYILMNIQINAKDINDFKTLLDNDERVIRHLVITMKKAETAQTTPPPEFSTVADDGFLDDEEELEENEDVEEEYDDEDAEEEDDDEGDQEIEVAKEEVVIEA